MPATSILIVTLLGSPAHPLSAPGVTSLTNPAVRYQVPAEHSVQLRRGPVTAVIVDNRAIESPVVGQHRAGYNGIAVLKHRNRDENLFVAGIAGLNFEHIHDGTLAVAKEPFEPRRFPMQLRVVDPFTVEVHQPPTGNWRLESCGRYRLLPDGAIEYTFECIPRADVFRHKTIGLFWASYIQSPEDTAIHFRGSPASGGPVRWIRAVSPKHGIDSTHPPEGESLSFFEKIDSQFPLTLVNHRSGFVYRQPWYYGVSHGMAFVQAFRPGDRIWLAQSPSGGGRTNPAWDFQWFIPECRVGEAYGFVMRALYVPWSALADLEPIVAAHRAHLGDR